MKIRLRKVRADDGDDLARIWMDQAQVYAELDPDMFATPDAQGLGAWLVEGLRAQADPDRRLVLVADVDGAAVGFLVAAVVDPHATPQHQSQRDLVAPRVQIEALAVRRDWWRHGVGTRLTTAAEDWARNRGATVISTQTYVRGPAADFFAARGYDQRAVVHGKGL